MSSHTRIRLPFRFISRFQRWIGWIILLPWAVGPERGPRPSISAGVRDFYIARLWRLGSFHVKRPFERIMIAGAAEASNLQWSRFEKKPGQGFPQNHGVAIDARTRI